jgi:pimeloyl-ACP methyl ester carboxylesterase
MDDGLLQRRSVFVNGLQIFYRETGSGHPLLLLHGVGHSSTAWLRSLPILGIRHRAIAPDFPGVGQSDVPDARFDPAFFARFALDFLGALGLERVDVAGNSLGGLTAMLAALDRPAVFRRLIAVDPLGFTIPPVPPLDDAVLTIIGLWLSFPRTRALVRAGYASGFFDPRLIDEASVDEIADRAQNQPRMDAARKTLREIFHFSKHLDAFHRRLMALPQPAMIVWGANDPVLPVKDVEIARRVLPRSRIEVLDRCGHCPHIERSEAFCALVLDFLNAT